MAHSAQPDAPPHRTRDRIIGIASLVIAIPVIVVLVIALRHPKGPHAANEASAGAVSSTPSASVSKSVAAPRTSATTASTPPSTPVSTTTPTTSTTPTTAVTSTTTPANVAPASVRLPIIVLNNSAGEGAAATATSRFVAGGWQASNGGNFQGDILSTVAYYNPNADGSEAAAEALQKQFPAIRRVRPFVSGLPDAPVVVVLTSDYS
jgi:hypothetical protein